MESAKDVIGGKLGKFRQEIMSEDHWQAVQQAAEEYGLQAYVVSAEGQRYSSLDYQSLKVPAGQVYVKLENPSPEDMDEFWARVAELETPQ